jgi:hypothetical protein
MNYNPSDYNNNSASGRNNRLWLERNLLVDDLPRAGIRKERSAQGKGIGPWLGGVANKLVGSFLSTVPECSDHTGGGMNN